MRRPLTPRSNTPRDWRRCCRGTRAVVEHDAVVAGWDADRFAWVAILLGGVYAAAAFALMNAARPGFGRRSGCRGARALLLCWYVLRGGPPARRGA
jgi:hypothetical protein